MRSGASWFYVGAPNFKNVTKPVNAVKRQFHRLLIAISISKDNYAIVKESTSGSIFPGVAVYIGFDRSLIDMHKYVA